jgi:type IV/VI secretion system ImpK/VasF family protein
MKIVLWTLITDLRREVRRLIERTLVNTEAYGPLEQAPKLKINKDTLDGLRLELRDQLDQVQANFIKETSEAEARQMMFPLVLLCDEMVMARIPKEKHTMWHLIQSDMFKFNHGGDVFYDFVDERLAKSDTPPRVFEVLYYCLCAGFAGKLDSDVEKIGKYQGLLAERIPGALPPTKAQRRKRLRSSLPATAPEKPTGKPTEKPLDTPTQSPRFSLWYYAAAVMLLFMFVGGILMCTNL